MGAHTKRTTCPATGRVDALVARCHQCATPGQTPFRCAGCQAVSYCSRDHQAADAAKHKILCNRIQGARAKAFAQDNTATDGKKEAKRLSDIELRCQQTTGLFELAHGLLNGAGTRASIAEAIGHMHKALESRLGKSDPAFRVGMAKKAMNAESVMPAAMLRLDRDAECVCFLTQTPAKYFAERKKKYCAKTQLQTAWTVVTGPSTSQRGSTAMLLLRLKLLVDIQNLKTVRRVFASTRTGWSCLPVEMQDEIALAACRSPLAAKVQVLGQEAVDKVETTLLAHATRLGYDLATDHQQFIAELIGDPAPPSFMKHGSGESRETLGLRAAWRETEGVMDLLRDARAIASRRIRERAAKMARREHKRGSAARAAANETSLRAMWQGKNLRLALANMSRWGPLSARPSERQINWVDMVGWAEETEKLWAELEPERD